MKNLDAFVPRRPLDACAGVINSAVVLIVAVCVIGCSMGCPSRVSAQEASTVKPDWKPALTFSVVKALDIVTSARHNDVGGPCFETNAWFQTPDGRFDLKKGLAGAALAVGIMAITNHLLNQLPASEGKVRRIVKGSIYGSSAHTAWNGPINNVRKCGW